MRSISPLDNRDECHGRAPWLNKNSLTRSSAELALRIVLEGKRRACPRGAGMVKKAGPEVAKFDINAAIEEVLA